MKETYTKEEVLNIIFQLDKWIEQSNESAETFKKNNMASSEITSQAMAQSYWNVKQFIIENLDTGESNYVVIEKEKFLDMVSTASSFATFSGIDRQELKKAFFDQFGIDLNN